MEGLGLSVDQGLGLGKPAPAQDKELDSWVDSIIGKNTNLNFIDRVARPDQYPTLPMPDGTMATHLMSWGDIDGKPAVFPTVIFDPNTKGLQALDMDAAFEHAMKTKEYLPFDNEEMADLFSKEYKRHWREGKGPKGYQK
jgi:hypothetical protein